MYSRHVEGDISSDVCRQMEDHLRHCPKCNGACDSLRRTLALCGSSRTTVPVATQFMVRRALGRVFGGVTLTEPADETSETR
jgi:RNA polymerase sigma-70 factor (ECF subfamily)